jgi:hypothetical protein
MITAVLLIIPVSEALEGTDEHQTKQNRLKYDPLIHGSAGNGEPDLYLLNHARNNEKTDSTKVVKNTVSPEDTVMSYTSIRNNPAKIVSSISRSFSVREPGAHSSFRIEVPSTPADIVMLGAAFLTNLAFHEVGHEVVAHHVGASGSRLEFFQTRHGQFFLGTSSVEDIDNDSIMPYTIG